MPHWPRVFIYVKDAENPHSFSFKVYIKLQKMKFPT